MEADLGANKRLLVFPGAPSSYHSGRGSGNSSLLADIRQTGITDIQKTVFLDKGISRVSASHKEST
jgi:hypothetical protein